jgi:hypothetical protein
MIPGLGSGGGKFQLSVGWRQSVANRSYIGHSFNRSFTDLWQPRERLSIMDVSARYFFNRRFSVIATLPIEFNRFSMLFPPKGTNTGTGKGLREGAYAEGIGDLQFVTQYALLEPRDHPYENCLIGLGMKIPTGNWDEKRLLPNLDGTDVKLRTVYPAAIMPGDGGVGIIGSLDTFKTFRGPTLLRGQTAFLSGSYLANPRNTNNTPSIVSSAGVPLTPNFLNQLTNSVADAYAVQAGFSLKIPGTWNNPKLKSLRPRLVYRWEGVRNHDIFGPAGGFRQPGYAMSFGPGVSYSLGKNTIMVDVPITFNRFINGERSEVPGPSNGIFPAAFNPGRNLGLVAPVAVAVRYVRSI